jgi:hypothetical protein
MASGAKIPAAETMISGTCIGALSGFALREVWVTDKWVGEARVTHNRPRPEGGITDEVK